MMNQVLYFLSSIVMSVIASPIFNEMLMAASSCEPWECGFN